MRIGPEDAEQRIREATVDGEKTPLGSDKKVAVVLKPQQITKVSLTLSTAAP